VSKPRFLLNKAIGVRIWPQQKEENGGERRGIQWGRTSSCPTRSCGVTDWSFAKPAHRFISYI